jgi:hypothetical protein
MAVVQRRIVPIAIGAAIGLGLHLAAAPLQEPPPLPPLSSCCGCLKG